MRSFSPRPSPMTSAVTLAPLTTGVPTRTCAPSATSSTSSKVTAAPASAPSFSTRMVSPSCTRYCLPPVAITAYMKSSQTLRTEARSLRLRPFVSTLFCRHHLHQHRAQDARELDAHALLARFGLLPQPHHLPPHINGWVLGRDHHLQVHVGP